MHSDKPLAVSTPVTLRLENGKEAGGQVAFCKGSPSNDKLWGIGIVLDQPGNFWGLDPCPKDWAVAEENAASSPSGSTGEASGAKAESAVAVTTAEVERMRAELREQMRQELTAVLAEAQAKFNEEVQTQRKNTALAEGLLQDAVKVRESLTLHEQELTQKLADGTKNAIERIEASMNALKLETQYDSEQQQAQVRKEAEEAESRLQKNFTAQMEKAQSQLAEAVDEKKKDVAEAASSIGQVSDKIYADVQKRLENDLESQKEMVASIRNTISGEVARLQGEVGGVDERIVKMRELSAQVEKDFGTRLDQSAADAMKQAQASLDHVLGGLRTEQTAQARKEMEDLLAPISTRADALKKELSDAASALTRERDEIQQQVDGVKRTKEEMQVWIAQQVPGFQKTVQDVLSEAKGQAKTIMQTAISTFQDPVEKFNRQAKGKIEEFMAQQHSELDEGTRRLRNLLATLEQQAEDSLRGSFEVNSDAVAHKEMSSPDKLVTEALEENQDKLNPRGQTTLAKKLSGLVRGQKA